MSFYQLRTRWQREANTCVHITNFTRTKATSCRSTHTVHERLQNLYSMMDPCRQKKIRTKADAFQYSVKNSKCSLLLNELLYGILTLRESRLVSLNYTSNVFFSWRKKLLVPYSSRSSQLTEQLCGYPRALSTFFTGGMVQKWAGR